MRPSVVADRGNEQWPDGIAPTRETVDSGQRASRASGQGFLDVSGGRIKLWSAFRLKPQVQFADIMKGGQHAEPSAISRADLAVSEPGESFLPHGGNLRPAAA